jgi:hypothetical protein
MTMETLFRLWGSVAPPIFLLLGVAIGGRMERCRRMPLSLPTVPGPGSAAETVGDVFADSVHPGVSGEQSFPTMRGV